MGGVGKKKYRDREWLYQKYIIEERSAIQIGELAGCHSCTIAYWLTKHGIPIRDMSQVAATRFKNDDQREMRSRMQAEKWTEAEYRQKQMEVRHGQDFHERQSIAVKAAKGRRSRPCRECQSSFIPRWHNQVYCSGACTNEARKEGRLGKPIVSIVRRCAFCGNKFRVQPARLKDGRGRYCSKKCLNQYNGPTSIEAKIAALLDKMGVPYEAQKPIRPFICDFAVVKTHVIIECDGDYWHSLPKVKEKDRRKNKFLAGLGYTVVRLPEHKINDDIAWCEEKIRAALGGATARRQKARRLNL